MGNKFENEGVEPVVIEPQEPSQSLETTWGDETMKILNFSDSAVLSEDYLARMQGAVAALLARFPALSDILREKINSVSTEDMDESVWGDPEKYPTNGLRRLGEKEVVITNHGLEERPHRISAASNLEGTLVHELTHFIQEAFTDKWSTSFAWERCENHPERWEQMQSPDGKLVWWIDKSTGEVSPSGEYPDEPDQCVTEYAKLSMNEDICESMVAYLYSPERLKEISKIKYDILDSYQEPNE